LVGSKGLDWGGSVPGGVVVVLDIVVVLTAKEG
jgi:hypothetical protein